MRVAIITSQAFSMVNFRAPLIRDLNAAGVEVYALAPDYDAALREQVKALGAVPVDYPMARAGLNPAHDLLGLVRMFALLRRLAPDVVLAYFIKPVIYGTLAAWAARVPRRLALIEGLGYVFVDTAGRQSLPRRLLRRAVTAIYALALRGAHQAFVLNREDMTDLVAAGILPRHKAVLLGPIGVDLEEWRPQPMPDGPPTFLLAARLLREKGIPEYAEAARQIKSRYPYVRFILLGALDPNPGGLSRRAVEQWVAEGILEWPGHVDVKPWLAQASVYVLPSYYREGVPRSTQEAMALGRPVITTDVPGCRDTVEDGKNGYLVPPRDVDALAAAMRGFVQHPERIAPMGRESRRMAEARFDVHRANATLLAAMGIAASEASACVDAPERVSRCES